MNMNHNGMIRPKFYTARRDTRWDVYPSEEPLKVVVHNWEGFYDHDAKSLDKCRPGHGPAVRS